MYEVLGFLALIAIIGFLASFFIPIRDGGRVVSVNGNKAIVLFDESSYPPVGNVCEIPATLVLKENDWVVTEWAWGKVPKIVFKSTKNFCKEKFKQDHLTGFLCLHH